MCAARRVHCPRVPGARARLQDRQARGHQGHLARPREHERHCHGAAVCAQRHPGAGRVLGRARRQRADGLQPSVP
eukprot:6981977-Prymnesium_polylepis.1